MNRYRYCYVDTCVISDMLKQYNALHPYNAFSTSTYLKQHMLVEINRAVETKGEEGMIITSAFTFVELINKFFDIFNDSKVQVHSIRNFLKQPPSWITIEDINTATSLCLTDIPQKTPSGAPISGDDAIHIATAISRGETISFCTTDSKLKQLNLPNILFI